MINTNFLLSLKIIDKNPILTRLIRIFIFRNHLTVCLHIQMLAEIEDIVREAGDFLLTNRGGFSQTDIREKTPNQLVSYIDEKTEELLVSRFKMLLPGSDFITEEDTTTGRSGAEWTWIIDPLDGTTNYLHGLEVFSVSVALARRGVVEYGVVLDPVRNEMFSAKRGEGASLNGRLIQVSTAATLKDSLLATGFPYYDYEMMEDYLKVLRYFMQHTHGLRRLGSAALDLCYTACGRFEGFFEYALKPWDISAGALIVTEAGGVLSDFSGRDSFWNGEEIIAACPGIYQAFYKILNTHFKK